MPGVAEVDAIEATLKASLGGRRKVLDQNVAAAAQRLLQQNIDFVPATKPLLLQLSSLKSKYILLQSSKQDEEREHNCRTSVSSESGAAAGVKGPGPSGDAKMGESLPSPRVVIYPPEQIKLGWRQMHKVGGGLVNMGNTCYMNSTLQCLTYTAPLVNYCISDEHPKTCKQQNMCVMCAMRQHIRTALHASGSAFKPHSILKKMKVIAKHFRHGRQEDAHEFLRYLIDGMQKGCLGGHKGLDKFSKETTVIHHIFGGFLRSQVLCLKCSARSNTYEAFMDLSLDIKGVSTLEGALAKYVKAEPLEAANAYDCKKCRKKTPAKKRFSLHKVPNVLTLQLNRFNFSRFAGKINKYIQFPEKLDVRPYMSQKQGEPVHYHLYGVLIHAGHHCSMGHYYCYAKAPSNVWYVMNDSSVHTVSASRVLQSEAYLLFYSKAVPSQHHTPAKTPLHVQTSNGPITPRFNGAVQKQGSSISSTPAKASNDVGVSVSRQMVSPTKELKTHPLKMPGTPSMSSPVSSTKELKTHPLKMPGAPSMNGPVSSPSKSPKLAPLHMGASVKAQKGSPTKSPLTSPLMDSSAKVQKSSSTNTPLAPHRKSPKMSKDATTSSSDERGKKCFTEALSASSSQPAVKPSSSAKQGQSSAGSGSRIVMQIKGGKVTTYEKPVDGTPVTGKDPKKSTSVNSVKDSGSEELTSSEGSKKKSSDKDFKLKSKEKGKSSGGPDPARSGSSSQLSDSEHGKKDSDHLPSTPASAKPSAFASALSRSNSAPVSRDSNGASGKTVTDATPGGLVRRGSGLWCVQDSAPTPALLSDSDHSSRNKRLTLSAGKRISFGWSVTESPAKTNSFLLSRSGLVGDHPQHGKKLKRSSSDYTELQKKHGQLLFETNDDALASKEAKLNTNRESEAALGSSLELKYNSGAQTPTSHKERIRLDTPQHAKHTGDTAQHNGYSSLDDKPLGGEDGSAATKHKHKKKKKKKHKEHSEDSVIDTSAVLETTETEAGRSGRKHKKTKHRRNSEASEPGTETDKDSSEAKGESVSNHKRKWQADCRHSDREDPHPKKSSKLGDTSRHNLNDSDGEPPQKDKAKKSVGASESSVPVQAWDHYVKDSLVKNAKRDKSAPKSTLMWDGSKKSHVLDELQKRPAVTTWNGERSEAEIEAEKEERKRKRKTWSDHYNEEIDTGKVKKIKRKAEESPWSFNPFQKVQNDMNMEKRRWSDVDFAPARKAQSWEDTAHPSSFDGSRSDLDQNGRSPHQKNGHGHSPSMLRAHSFH